MTTKNKAYVMKWPRYETRNFHGGLLTLLLRRGWM